MADADLCFTPATELARRIRLRDLSPVEVTRAVLDRIDRINPTVGAYCTVTADLALEAARTAEAAVPRGEPLGPLHGVPVSIKDMVATKGIRTTWGSRVFERHVPAFDAPVVERLKRAGAIVLGKTNTPEFGHRGVTHNQVFGLTRNPWRLDHSPGGSSGGAGAAVAAGLGPLAVGTDGGGSIRIPASFCGIYGLKPSLGRVPIHPVVSGLEFLSHAGPMTRTVADAALMLDVMAGPDDRDISTIPAPADSFAAALRSLDVRGLRVAWSPTLGYAAVDREVATACAHAVHVFERLGCVVEPVETVCDDPVAAWYLLFIGIFGAARRKDFAQVRQLMEPSVVAMVEQCDATSASDFLVAANERRRLLQRVGELLARYDLLVTPTMAVPPLPIGQDDQRVI
ncbi:MAG: amidase, partial [Actinobacteria bacterium]|nr:amidase [Actinomycetota bacterium]